MSTVNHVCFRELIKTENILTVDGYIREIQPFLSKFLQIPKDINKICFEYYHAERDRFCPVMHEEEMEVTDTTITSSNPDGGAAYLSNICKQGIHHWKFEIIKHSPISQLYFAVRIIENINVYDVSFRGCVYSGTQSLYGINARYGQLRGNISSTKMFTQYCDKAKTGDIVEMILDLNKYQLKYIINDVDRGNASDVAEAEYQAVVAVDSPNESIKLLNYEHY